MVPWTDRRGQFSWLKTAALVAALMPALWVAYRFNAGALGALPVKTALHLIGTWALRFLIITQALTPVQRIFAWPRLILLRRIAGVTAWCYALLHLVLYVVYSKFDLTFVAAEIATRAYLTLGFAVWLGLTALAATSFDRAISRLGRRWTILHRFIYPLTALALLHAFIQAKLDVTASTVLLGLFVLEMLVRLAVARRMALSPGVLGACALATGALTAGLEAAWYGVVTGVSPRAVLMANASLHSGLRPALLVTLLGLVLAGLVLLRNMAFSKALRRQQA
jgi:sulfoxide reductase heme-binding subunit YedZ